MSAMTVQELITTLEDFDPDAVVRLAIQPSWPFEYRIGDVIDAVDEAGNQLVYLAEGGQVRYLPGDAKDALCWGR